ncbi:hypothetical protein B7463_g11532, partial [Scytalidium lignicola]
MDNKEHYRIPVLTQENYEIWFQDMKFKLEGKDIFYVIEVTKHEYAWIKRVLGSTPTIKTPISSDNGEPEANKLTSQFEQLGGTWNEEKAKEYKRDQAKAFFLISTALSTDDKSAIGEYEKIKEFWNYLKLKYSKTSQTTAYQYMTKLQTFEFDDKKGLDVAWTKLKEYRRKAIAANAALKTAYSDEALFLILTRAFLNAYKLITRGFIT